MWKRRLRMMSGKTDYEVILNEAGLLLGRVEKDGTRIRLCAGSNTEAQWERLLAALRNSEGEGRPQ